MGEKFSEKIAFGSFTTGTYVTYGAAVWSNRRIDMQRPFKEAAIINNLDQDIEVFDPADINQPLVTIKASGGSFTFERDNLLHVYYPFLVRNNSGSNATSGNVVMTMIR